MTGVARLHLISDRRLCPLGRFPDVAMRAVEGGVDAVHLREKDLAGGVLKETVAALVDLVGDRAHVFVNERVDVALVAGAAGVQLGEESLRPADVRRLAAGRLVIGRSVHDVVGAVAAWEGGADFLIAGHIFATTSKVGQPGRGLSFLAEVTRSVDIPVIAIGGITPERVEDVLDAGAHGVAVLSGILSAPDPASAARRYRRALDGKG